MASVTENKKPLNDLINFKCHSCIKKVENPQKLFHCGVRNGFYFLDLQDDCWSYSDDAEAWLKTLLDIQEYYRTRQGPKFGSLVRDLNKEIQHATKTVNAIQNREIHQVMAEDRKRGKGGGGSDPVGKSAEGCRLKDNRYKMKWGDES